MTFDFDTPVPLKNTHSAKWDLAAKATEATGDNIIPMWVADMDFSPAPAVTKALQAEIDRNTYGYYGDDSTVRAAICNWMRTEHDWEVQPGWIHFTHGVVHAFAILLEAFSEPGDEILLFTPVYHAFARKIRAKGRVPIECQLTLQDGQYHMDLDAAAALVTGRTKAVVHCSPHNPGGRLWTPQETTALADFAAEHGLKLISDEIHQDLCFPGAKHTMTACAAPQHLDRTIVITAASKGFNLAGAETGFIITPDDDLRAEVASAHASHGGSPNRFGLVMTEAALTGGKDWSNAVRRYIADNFALFSARVSAVPGLACMEMNSTYLAWVDFSGTGMEMAEFQKRVGDAGLAVNDGPSFGAGGESYLRFNLAMPRSFIEEACTRLEAAFGDLQ